MTGFDDMVREAAALAGVRLAYEDGLGRHVETPIDAARAVLAALGLAAGDEVSLRDGLEALRKKSERLAPEYVVSTAGEAVAIPLAAPDGDAVEWRIADESGGVAEGRSIVATEGERPAVRLPALPSGYHHATLTAGGRTTELTIVAAPQRCWRPDQHRPRWGLFGPVYGLSSAVDLGIGDFGDLGAFAAGAARRGADFLGMSPLHMLFPADRTRISPYSPSSRLFIDPIYADPRKAPGLAERAGALLAEAAGDGRMSRARSGSLVDYAAVWSLKEPIFRALWEVFRDTGGAAAFDAFRRERGRALERHATFEAFAEMRAASGDDAPYRHIPAAGSSEIGVFAGARGDRIAYHAWLQWLCDLQFAAADAQARGSGMEIGLLADLAVGVHPEGSETWIAPEHYLAGLSVGAPPDQLAPHGQNWGLRALSPTAMTASGMAGFRTLIAANMRHCGAIRIDHAFQLRRLYLVPDGASSGDGAYLTYPTDAMLAVLRIESHRARCMVIGEDLGTRPPGFSETMLSSGVLGYRVLYFERDHSGAFAPPAAYDEPAMAVINTHDLATFEGWWRGTDIEDRLRYGVMNEVELERSRQERESDRYRLMALLRAEGLAGGDGLPDRAPLEPVARLLARCRSELAGLQLDDIAGAVDQQNVPGIVDDAPNWRRRLPMTIGELAAIGGPLDSFAAAMAAEGRNLRHVPVSQSG